MGNSLVGKGAGGDLVDDGSAESELEDVVPNPASKNRLSNPFRGSKPNKSGVDSQAQVQSGASVDKNDLLTAEKISTLNAAKSAAVVAALANEKRKRKVFDDVPGTKPKEDANEDASESESKLSQPKESSENTASIPSSSPGSIKPKTDTSPVSTPPRVPLPKILPNAFLNVKLNKVKKKETGVNIQADTPRKSTKMLTCSKTCSKIYGHLYVSGDLVARNLDMLKENGISHILNLAKTVCKDYHADEVDEDGKPLFVYKSFNLIDSTKEGGIYPFILESLQFIEEARKKNGKCYVHCHQGVSRSCTMTIAYAMWYEKMLFNDAFNMVKKKHPVCGPNSAFIGQLLEWEKRLRLNPKIEYTDVPEMYRIAPHSSKYRTLVIKHCINDGDRTPVDPGIDTLDPRGTFLLHVPSDDVLYLWQGKMCKHPLQYAASASLYYRLMKKFEQRFENTALIHLDKNKKDECRKMFTLLGGEESEVEERSLYDNEYDTSKQQGEDDQDFTAGNVDSNRLRARSRATTAESSYRGSDDDSRVVRLYQWQSDSRDWELVTSYDSEDLQSDQIFVLTVHDKKIKGNTSAAYIHIAYVWLGMDIEGMISEEGAIAEAKTFIRAKEKCTKNRTEPIEIVIARDMSEPDEFWDCFEAGL